MNISEFERNKPVKTMSAINSLILEIKNQYKESDYPDEADWIIEELKKIKTLLKNGE